VNLHCREEVQVVFVARCAMSPETVAAIAPSVPSTSRSHALERRLGLLPVTKSRPALTKSSAIGKWLRAPCKWFIRFSKSKKSPTVASSL
jgi:hypothetical protein